MLYAGFLAQIYGLGTSTAFGFFYWDVYKNEEELKSLISSTIGLSLVIQVIIFSIAIFQGEFFLKELIHADEALTKKSILIMLLSFSAFSVFYEMFLYLFRNQGKIKQYALLSISTLLLLTLGTLYTVVVLDWKAEGAIIGRTAGYGIVISLFFIYVVKKYGISFNWKKSKRLLHFGLPLFVNSMIGAIAFGADRLMIERFSTLESLGIYGFALVLVTVIEIWFNALNNAISPTIYQFMNEAMEEKTKEIQGLAHLIICSVLLLIALIIAFIYPVLDWLIPESFHQAAVYIPVLAVAFLWRVFSTLCTYSVYLEKKTKLLLINQSVNLIVLVVSGYFGYQYFGISGIAYAVLLTRIVEFLIMRKISNHIRKLPLKLGKFALFGILFSAIGVGCHLYANSNTNPAFIYLTPLVFLLITIPLLLNKELKNIRYILINRKKLF